MSKRNAKKPINTNLFSLRIPLNLNIDKQSY
jgi:hypothetical protein